MSVWKSVPVYRMVYEKSHELYGEQNLMMFEYYYGQQSEQFSFYRIPKALFDNDEFDDLSTDSKLLYGIMLDRMRLSVRNSWLDDENRVYIVFTIDEIKDSLRCAEKKAVKMMDELQKIGLIERKRQGLGKPNLIFVKNFVSGTPKGQFKNCQNDNSGIVKTTTLELSKGQCSNTNISNTDINDTDYYPSYHIITDEEDMDKSEYGRKEEKRNDERDRKKYRELIKENIDYEVMISDDPDHADILDEILDLMVDVVCTNTMYIRVSGDDKPAETVRSQFLKLDSGHIKFVMDCLRDNTTKIRNMRQYMIAALYNAPMTIGNYYRSLVNHDMFGK